MPLSSQRLSRATHPSILSRLAGAQFADCITCLATCHFVSVWTDTEFSPVHSLCFQKHFWTCLVSELHLFSFSPSQCAPIGSAEPITNTFLVAWPAYNLLIASLALPPTILFQFEQTIAFQPVHLFYIYTDFSVWICLNMFRFWASSICLFSILLRPHRLSRAIHQHIFSCLAGTQFADCITYLTYTYFVLVCTDYYIFAILLIIYFCVWTCLYMFRSHVSLICYLSTPVCSHRLNRVTMDRHPKGSALLSWPAKSNLSPHSIVGTHSYVFYSSPQNPHYPVQDLPTSHLNWSDKTLSYPSSCIKTLELTPLKAASSWTIQPFTPSHTSPHTLIYKSVNHLNHLFLPG